MVARRRLRAGRNQISLATRVARSKRIELEQCLIVYSVLKQENAARESSKTSTPSTLRQRSTPGSRNSASGNNNRPPQRLMGELQDHEVVNLVRLLRELDGLSPENTETTRSGSNSPAREGPATLQELVTGSSGAAPPPPSTGPRRINLDGTERTPPSSPPRPPGSGESRTSASGGGGGSRHRHHHHHRRHRTPGASAEAPASSNTVRDVSASCFALVLLKYLGFQLMNSPTRAARPRSNSNPPAGSSDGPNSAAYLAELNAADSNTDSNLNENEDNLSLSSGGGGGSSEGEDDEDAHVSAAMTEAIIESLGRQSRRMGASTAQVEQGERVARSVASDIRMARLTRRAEEEAALNRAILMSIQDSALAAGRGDLAGGDTVAPASEEDIDTMMAMGFGREEVVQALRETRNNVEAAANRLLMGNDF